MTLGVGLAAWALLALAAFAVGFSKTAISGASMLAIVLFAAVLPVRESTGALLVLLLVGDLVATWTYRRDAQWALLRRLVAPVLVGLAVGAAFLAWAPVTALKPVIGAIVVVMTLVQIWRKWAAARASAHTTGDAHDGQHQQHGGGVFGALAGFTTMVANAGGPVMTLYLLRSRLDVVRFVGTLAWFFFSVNLVKLPISIGLGLVRPSRLLLCLSLVPLVLVGAWVGRQVIARMPREVFEWVVLVVAGLSGCYLIVS